MDEMKVLKTTAQQFLLRHHMHAGQICMEAELEKLLKEMRQVRSGALCADGNVVKMIPTFVGSFHSPAAAKSVTVIDIGGTNVRSAVITADAQGAWNIRNRISFLTPGVTSPTDTAHFFREIAKGVRENLTSEEIGICFSLATIPTRDRDAVMCAGGKQIQITDMLGKKVGQSFREALRFLGLPDGQRITVINDTVAAALAGLTKPGADASRETACIGFIYGTGTNLCYRESRAGTMINVESGAYCGFPAGDIDDRYDQGMIDPGADRFEKMVSGGYQGGLMEYILRAAAEEGDLSYETRNRLFASSEPLRKGAGGTARSSFLTSRDISAFSNDPEGGNRIAKSCASEQDRAFLCALFDEITRRSACLCAIAITAALKLSPSGGTACITAEGSTFLKQKDFRRMLEAFLSDFAAKQHGFSFEIHTVEDAVLRGTGAACLSAL